MRPLGNDELVRLLDLAVERPLRALQGRETFLHRAADGRTVVVKRSRPAARPGGRREHEALVRLFELGFAVPASLGFAEGPAGSVVVMEHVAHEETVRDRLARAGASSRRALLDRVADLLAALQRAGWRHRDFYAHHLLLVPGTDAIVLVDVGRAGRAPFPRGRWFVKDAGALLHSLPGVVTRAERLRFLARVASTRGSASRAERRAFVRAALRKAARIGRHVPRDERAAAAR